MSMSCFAPPHLQIGNISLCCKFAFLCGSYALVYKLYR